MHFRPRAHGIRLAVTPRREMLSRMRLSIAGCLRYAAPQAFHALAGRLVPWFAAAAVLFALAGLYVAFLVAPTDPKQGEVFRIVFVHVPAAAMSLFLYVVMALWAAAGLALNTRLAFMMTQALAPTGALFTFLALWTGAIWGKPAWGTWWVWDARMVSELALLVLYLGIIGLNAAIDDVRRADRAGAVLALLGTVNVPVIYYTVPSLSAGVLAGTLLMAGAFWAYSNAVALARVRCEILEREQESRWAELDATPEARPA